MKNTNTITLPALDFWAAFDMINTLSGIEGADETITALEEYIDENAPEFATRYAQEGDIETAEMIMGMYDGDQASDPDNPCFDPTSPWITTARAIRLAERKQAARDAVENWFETDARREDDMLRDAAHFANANPRNLYDAGKFDGMARMVAATIIDNGADRGASETQLTVAIYNRYGVAW